MSIFLLQPELIEFIVQKNSIETLVIPLFFSGFTFQLLHVPNKSKLNKARYTIISTMLLNVT